MSRLNNKGYMLVEIILASALAFGLAFFLLDLTVKLKNKNDDLLVRTLVSTDQAIVMNTIMKQIEEDFEGFSCDKIKFTPIDDGGYTFTYDGEVKSIITKYATVSYDSKNDCKKDENNQTAMVNVDIKVKQLPDEDFSSNIDYAEKYYGISCPKSDKEPNAPVLDSGMIPVVISDDGTVTTVSSSNADNKWYDYDSQKWTNAILVKEDGKNERTYYQEYANVEVEQSDILAYFVWIPRYSYAFTKGDGAREICIQFERKDDTKRTGTAMNRNYYTHPSFTFGDEELSGIWVGKFETSVDTSNTCYTTMTSVNSSTSNPYTSTTNACNKVHDDPRIIPNVSALFFQTISKQFQTSLKFAGGTLSNAVVTFEGNSTFGLSSTADSHMMKNSEWGAVAYLTNSRYGIYSVTGGEISTNEYCKYQKGTSVKHCFATMTGCGSDGDSDYTDCEMKYGSLENDGKYYQSTTGNISGIFDMSGGMTEYVMGVMSDSSGKLFSGKDKTAEAGHSEFNGLLTIGGSITDGIDFPPSKYYDVYSLGIFSGTESNNYEKCTLSTCGGHALYETNGWNSDETLFIFKYSDGSDGSPWFRRGGFYYSGDSAGVFHYMYDNGDEGLYYLPGTFRTVLATG